MKALGVTLVVLAGVVLSVGMARAEVIVMFQQGALIPTRAGGNGLDTYSGNTDVHLRETPNGNPAGDVCNTGQTTYLVAGQYGDAPEDDVRPLIDFSYGSLSAYMAANNLKIQSVTLKLYLNRFEGASGTTGQTVDMFKATSSFTEGSASGERDGAQANAGESCFKYQAYDTTGWASTGGYHGTSDWSTELNSGTVLSATGTWYTFDVTGGYSENGSDLTDAHMGFVMLTRTDDANPYYDGSVGGRQACFSSAQNGDNRPILELTLVEVPEPATLSILVAGTTAGLIRRKRR